MKNGIIGRLFTEYEFAAANQDDAAPNSLIPSCNTWPSFASR